jgi:transcription initiation factor TFIID TATA-box-binding protein
MGKLRTTFDKFEELLSQLFNELPGYEIEFEIRNLAFVEQYTPSDSPLELADLVIPLGIENVEYEPEQFPGIFYRPPESPGLFLIFSSGKLVLTGVRNRETAEKSFEQLREKIDELYCPL